MSGWWFSRRSRTRRPKEKLALPGDVVILTPDRCRRAVGWVALRLLYLALLGGLVWLTAYLLTAPEFRIESVRVVGNHLVATEQVLAAGDTVGQSVFLVSSRRVEQAVLAIKPIRAARLTFAWPNLVTLEVVERTPFGIWRVGDASYLVSEEGVVLAPASGENLPVVVASLVVTDVDGQPVTVGGVVDKEVLAEAACLLTALNSAGLGVESLEYSRTYGLVAPGDRGTRVAFGRGESPSRRVAILRALLDELASRRLSAQFVDLRIEDRPYFR